MSKIDLPNRRGILGLGAAGVIAAAAGPSIAGGARPVRAPLKTFEARSSDGTVLHGDSVGFVGSDAGGVLEGQLLFFLLDVELHELYFL